MVDADLLDESKWEEDLTKCETHFQQKDAACGDIMLQAIQASQAQMQRSQVELESLQNKLSEFKDKAENNKKVMCERIDKMNNLKKLLGDITQEADNMVEKQAEAQQMYDNLREQNQATREELEAQSKLTEQKKEEVDKLAKLFEENLGLRMKKTAGGVLQFIFTCVNYRKPEEQFFFSLFIDEKRQYKVTLCDPVIPDLDELVKKLNETNNLQAFVVTVRKKFKQLTEKTS